MPDNNAAIRAHRSLILEHLYKLITANMLAAVATPFTQLPEYKHTIEPLISDLATSMHQGIKAYQTSPHTARPVQASIIWQSGSTTLERHPTSMGQNAKNQQPILLIPSLINRANILNLDHDISFATSLCQSGFDVYTLNWNTPSKAEADFSINDYIQQRILPAIVHLNQTLKTPPHLMGYCMGGTMAAAAASMAQNNIASLTMLAAPWDFHEPDNSISFRMQAYLMSATPVMAAQGHLPPDWIQLLFTSLDPLFAFNKFVKFAKIQPHSPDARRFVIVEDWLNDGVPLTTPAALQALEGWYIKNEPANGVWTVGQNLITEHSITVPVCVIASANDKLVPYQSAAKFMQQNESVTRISPPLGHIGMMVSSRAPKLVWQPLQNWLHKIAA